MATYTVDRIREFIQDMVTADFAPGEATVTPVNGALIVEFSRGAQIQALMRIEFEPDGKSKVEPRLTLRWPSHSYGVAAAGTQARLIGEVSLLASKIDTHLQGMDIVPAEPTTQATL